MKLPVMLPLEQTVAGLMNFTKSPSVVSSKGRVAASKKSKAMVIKRTRAIFWSVLVCVTVSVADALVTEPRLLVATTLNTAPPSAKATAGVV